MQTSWRDLFKKNGKESNFTLPMSIDDNVLSISFPYHLIFLLLTVA
jgi:hypothetical protein